MTVRAVEHHSHHPEPPVGTVLQCGSPTGDRVTFQRLTSGWQHAYGGDPMRPCTYALVLFWCPLRVVWQTFGDASPAPPVDPEAERLDDMEDPA